MLLPFGKFILHPAGPKSIYIYINCWLGIESFLSSRPKNNIPAGIMENSEEIKESFFDFDAFRKETELIQLVYFRNNNQHHVSYWWAHLDMLRRRCFQIIEEYTKIQRKRERLQAKQRRRGLNKSKQQNQKTKNIKTNSMKIEYNLAPIWIESKKIQQIAWFLYSKLIPSCRRIFHGILKQGAFITVGFTMLGFCANIYKLVTPIALTFKKDTQLAKKRASQIKQDDGIQTSLSSATPAVKMDVDLGEAVITPKDIGVVVADIGKAVTRDNQTPQSKVLSKRDRSLSPVLDLFDEPTQKKTKIKKREKDDKKKKKKKKSKSDLDSIFGF